MHYCWQLKTGYKWAVWDLSLGCLVYKGLVLARVFCFRTWTLHSNVFFSFSLFDNNEKIKERKRKKREIEKLRNEGEMSCWLVAQTQLSIRVTGLVLSIRRCVSLVRRRHVPSSLIFTLPPPFLYYLTLLTLSIAPPDPLVPSVHYGLVNSVDNRFDFFFFFFSHSHCLSISEELKNI